MADSPDSTFEAIAAEVGYDPSGTILVGGRYAPAVMHRDQIHVSGQIPRIGDTVVVTGRIGAETSFDDGVHAAKICTLRALTIVRQLAGSLSHVEKILRINVYVQCAPDFTRHSEVADGASAILHAVFGAAGDHARTSVGVYQLPKNASLELDMTVALRQQ